ncbi:MAG: hypothetical protein CR997_00670 [Acidobacteria bacterium]|nr:MAG: hypothetical protein CR997_00670 [Acidobacteriota bacterium]
MKVIIVHLIVCVYGGKALSRSILWAILAFSSLIVANLTVFAFLSFGPLSEKVVTEKLIQELNDASSLMRREFEASPLQHQAAQRVAPLLRKFRQFQAILLLDSEGKVIYREVIQKDLAREASPEKTRTRLSEPSEMKRISNAESTLVDGARISGIQNGEGTPANDNIALEYDSEFIQNEVQQVREQLFRQLVWAIAVSVILLITGGIYVVHAYKRNKKFQAQALKADRLAYVGTLASGLAHEIRNPLNSMNMNLQLIREDLVDMGLGQNTEIQEMFDGTSKEINRLSKLVSSFLAYARPSQLNPRVQSVNGVIQEVADFVSPEIEEREIRLELQLNEQLPQVPLDENQMRQALLNVIQNAIHVLAPQQLLRIITRKVGADHIIIAIEDEGPGIGPESLKEIHKVFYSTKKGGTGLGLPIAQRIAELHGGGLKIESAVGKGTTVTFVLPIQKREDAL